MASPTKGTSSTVLSPPQGYPDLYAKRREMARVQMLEREISFLEEELKSSEGPQPASRCCKEIVDFVVANSDPLLPTSKKNRQSCSFWKWLCGIPCFNLSWIWCWCCDGCFEHLNFSSCCSQRKSCNCCCNSLPSINCSLPEWHCCSGGISHCCKYCCILPNCCSGGISHCCKYCCILPSCNFRCPFPSCSICKCSCSCSRPSCPKVSPCCCCSNSCWNSCHSCC